jgi:DNA polymerase I-like protein with 3'-5' exonuclease and polymerase domains/uracil-DNA glycosylase
VPKKPRLQWEPEPWGPKCGDCPFKPWSRGYVEPRVEGSRVVAMGEAAGYWEALDGTPFAGAAGGKLNVWLGLAGLTRLDVDLVNACRCRPITWELCEGCWGEGEILAELVPDELTFEAFVAEPCSTCGGCGWLPVTQGDGDYKNATPDPDQITECMRRYGHELLRSMTNKRLIVAMGASALYAITGKDDIGSYQGSVLESEHGPVLATYHPAFALYEESQDPAAKRAFSRIPGILAGTEGSGLEITYIRDANQGLVNDYRTASEFVLDLETTGGKDPVRSGGDIVLAGASRRPGEAIVLNPEQLRQVLNEREPGELRVIGQYFYAYDSWWLHHRNYRVPDVIVDTQVLGHLANPSTPNDIGFLQTQYAEPPLREWWKSGESYDSDLAGVALRDADATGRVARGLEKHLRFTDQWGLAETVIIPWCRLAFELRRDGFRCDTGFLRGEASRIGDEVRRRGIELSSAFGIALPKKSKVGLPSPPTLAEYLYGTLGLPTQYHRKTGKRTADEPSLRKLRSWCVKNGHDRGLEFINEFIGKPDPEHRGEWIDGLKQLSTLGKDFAKFAGADGEGDEIRVVHPQPFLTRGDEDNGGDPRRGGTMTGRISYELFHQMPRHCRKAVLPDPGHVLVEFDYSQIEILVLLYFAEEWALLGQSLRGEVDFHTRAAQLFYETDAVTKAQRQQIKAVSLGMGYGKGVKTTAEDLELPEAEVEEMFKRWFGILPGVATLRKRWIAHVQTHGYFQTPAGWRMYFNRDEREHTHRQSVETQIYNWPIQSTAGIRTRAALVDVWREMSRMWSKDDVRMVLTVHDSGLYTVREDLVPQVLDLLRDVVTASYSPLPCSDVGMPDGLRFPIELKTGSSWGELTKVTA